MNEGLALKNVSFGHKNHALIFNKVNCQFPETGVIYLQGPNGIGKTTLLKLLSGIYIPHSGEIKLQNFNSHLKNYKRNIGYMHSNECSLLSSLTGYEILKLHYLVHLKNRLNKSNFDEEIIKIKSSLIVKQRFDEILNSKLYKHSTGMRNFLFFIRALMFSPRLLLLDEPLTGLDRDNRENFANLINQLKKTSLIIFSGHEKILNMNYQLMEISKGGEFVFNH